MNPLERFERFVSDNLRKLGGAKGHPAEPLEIRRDLLREIAGQAQPKGGGEYFFPYTTIQIEVFAHDASRKQVLEAMFAGRNLGGEIASALENSGCSGPVPQVLVQITEDPAAAAARPYRIEYSRAEPAPQAASKPRPPARLTVTQGQANVISFDIDRDLIYIGRTKEVVDKKTGVDRYNHLAFDDSEVKVSRKHAFVKYDSATGKFRAFNDPESQAGTTVIRDGKPSQCDSMRGVQLRSGDELVLGNARIRFELL